MLSINSDNLYQSRLHSQRFMKLARSAYACVLIIQHSFSVEHRPMDYYRCAKGRCLSLFHQFKAWSSAFRRYTRLRVYSRRTGAIVILQHFLCPMYFYPNFLEVGFHAGSQCGPRSGVAKCYI